MLIKGSTRIEVKLKKEDKLQFNSIVNLELALEAYHWVMKVQKYSLKVSNYILWDDLFKRQPSQWYMDSCRDISVLGEFVNGKVSTSNLILDWNVE